MSGELMTVESEQLQQILARHEAFWKRDPVEAPLVAHVPTRVWEPKPYPLQGGRLAMEVEPLLPEDLDLERLVGDEQRDQELLIGDLLTSVGPLYPQAWLEALIGCPIRVSPYGCVSVPTGEEVVQASQAFSVDQALASDWAKQMDRVLLRAVGLAQGRQPVRHLHLRGIIDMLAAYMGEEALCLAVFDHPGAVAQLASRFAELHVAVARRELEMISPWQGGSVSSWNLYAPGPLLDYQIDASSLFSAQTYGEHFFDIDRRVLASFPYSLIHLHACGLHQLDVVLDIPELGAIEISLDRETAVWRQEHVLACCKRIQDRGKSLLLSGELTGDEFGAFTGALDPSGLACYYWSP